MSSPQQQQHQQQLEESEEQPDLAAQPGQASAEEAGAPAPAEGGEASSPAGQQQPEQQQEDDHHQQQQPVESGDVGDADGAAATGSPGSGPATPAALLLSPFAAHPAVAPPSSGGMGRMFSQGLPPAHPGLPSALSAAAAPPATSPVESDGEWEEGGPPRRINSILKEGASQGLADRDRLPRNVSWQDFETGDALVQVCVRGGVVVVVVVVGCVCEGGTPWVGGAPGWACSPLAHAQGRSRRRALCARPAGAHAFNTAQAARLRMAADLLSGRALSDSVAHPRRSKSTSPACTPRRSRRMTPIPTRAAHAA